MNAVKSFIARYRKFLTAGAAGLGIVINESAAGGTVRWVDVALAVAGSLGVALVPNAPAPPTATHAPFTPGPVPPSPGT